MNFLDKRAVVVGGSKGLGVDVVAALAVAGCRVAVLARSEGQLGELQARFPGRIQLLTTDIANPESVRVSFQQIQTTFGGIDFLILNAAVAMPALLAQISDADIRAQLDINMAGPMYCLREAASLMTDAIVVYISSESVRHPFPMLALYAAAKAGMETFLNAVRGDLYSQGRNRVITFRVGSMGGTSFSSGWSKDTFKQFFEVASKSGHIGKGGTPMATKIVADAILHALSTPAAANIETIDFRSADAH